MEAKEIETPNVDEVSGTTPVTMQTALMAMSVPLSERNDVVRPDPLKDEIRANGNHGSGGGYLIDGRDDRPGRRACKRALNRDL
jgi:hypothetical protein